MVKGLKSVKERLEEMKKKNVVVPRPLDIPQILKVPNPESELITIDKVYRGKVEKAMKSIEVINQKIKTSGTYLNMYYNLKRAEDEFLAVLDEAKQKHIEFSPEFSDRIEAVKKRLRTRR